MRKKKPHFRLGNRSIPGGGEKKVGHDVSKKENLASPCEIKKAPAATKGEIFY